MEGEKEEGRGGLWCRAVEEGLSGWMGRGQDVGWSCKVLKAYGVGCG